MREDLDALERQADELLARSRELVRAATAKGERRLALPVSIQRESANRKLAPQARVLANNGRIRNTPIGPFVVSTYVSIRATCPDSCGFKSGGCYAIAGGGHLNGKALDAAARGWPADEVSRAEARAIDSLWPEGVPRDGARGGRDLRLHVGGEVSGPVGARALGDAAERWAARGGGRVWTFTHRWREIERRSWGRAISVLASCESSTEVAEAHARGYAAALVVDYFRSRKAFVVHPGVRLVPCPAEAGDDGRITCSSCRLCMDADRLLARGLTIAFAAHGSSAEAARAAARRRLPVL